MELDLASALNPNDASPCRCKRCCCSAAIAPTKPSPAWRLRCGWDPAWAHGYLHYLGTAYLLAGKYETAAALFREAHPDRAEYGRVARLPGDCPVFSGTYRRSQGHLGGYAADQPPPSISRFTLAACRCRSNTWPSSGKASQTPVFLPSPVGDRQAGIVYPKAGLQQRVETCPHRFASRGSSSRFRAKRFSATRRFGIDDAVLTRIAGEIAEAAKLGVKIGVVAGGGNIYRGMSIQKAGGNRVAGDQMGHARHRFSIPSHCSRSWARSHADTYLLGAGHARHLRNLQPAQCGSRLRGRRRGAVRGRHRQPVRHHRFRCGRSGLPRWAATHCSRARRSTASIRPTRRRTRPPPATTR